MMFHDLSLSDLLWRLGAFAYILVCLSACERREMERTTAAPPSLVTSEDVYEFVAPSSPMESRYVDYIPTQVSLVDPTITPAASGSGFVFRFSWNYRAAPMASVRSYLADWTVKGCEEGDSNEGSVANKFFFQKQKREFVSFTKLEAGRVYTFKIIVHVSSDLDNGDMFLSEVVLKKVRVDLRDL